MVQAQIAIEQGVSLVPVTARELSVVPSMAELVEVSSVVEPQVEVYDYSGEFIRGDHLDKNSTLVEKVFGRLFDPYRSAEETALAEASRIRTFGQLADRYVADPDSFNFSPDEQKIVEDLLTARNFPIPVDQV